VQFFSIPNHTNTIVTITCYKQSNELTLSVNPCILRFSEVETLTVLANLILRYKIELTPLNAQETLEEMNTRVLKWHQSTFTLRPTKATLTFTPRYQ
jgi:hypothetical protein